MLPKRRSEAPKDDEKAKDNEEDQAKEEAAKDDTIKDDTAKEDTAKADDKSPPNKKPMRKRIEAPPVDDEDDQKRSPPGKTKTVKATIFEFNEKAIVFEFELDGQENLIGMVKPTDLVVDAKSKKKIPSSVKTVKALSNFIQAGDEIECKVFEKKGLEPFKMVEEVRYRQRTTSSVQLREWQDILLFIPGGRDWLGRKGDFLQEGSGHGDRVDNLWRQSTHHENHRGIGQSKNNSCFGFSY